jgi:hypothetical protein
MLSWVRECRLQHSGAQIWQQGSSRREDTNYLCPKIMVINTLLRYSPRQLISGPSDNGEVFRDERISHLDAAPEF